MHIGRYTVLEELGQGGMGRVRLAQDPAGRRVVLKTVLSNDREDDERLRDEARVGLRLAHPHIVETVECFEHEGRPVLATVYVPGATVLELWKQGPLTASSVCRIGRQMSLALAAIHECKDDQGRSLAVLHRDVTSGNVLVDEAGDTRLIDLGIARSIESRAMRTETGMLRGTLRYLAPELFAGAAHTVQADLWALGVVLWEALVGRPAVQGSSHVAVMGRICVGDVMELVPGEVVDERIARTVSRLLRRQPADRPRTAREVAALFAMLDRDLQREHGDGGRTGLVRAVAASLAGGEADPRAVCGLRGEAIGLSTGSVDAHEQATTPFERRLVLDATGAWSPRGMPETEADSVHIKDASTLPPTPTHQGLLDYAARLMAMERSLSQAWAASDHDHEAVRSLDVVTGALVDDTAPVVAAPGDAGDAGDAGESGDAREAPLAAMTMPWVLTPATRPGLAPGGFFASVSTLPSHTSVLLPPDFEVPSAFDASSALHPTVLATEGSEHTPATVPGLALVPVDEVTLLRARLQRSQRLMAALAVVLPLVAMAVAAFVLLGR